MKLSTNGVTILFNKKARHEYKIENEYEAGIELIGSEIKSIRLKKCSMVDSYVVIAKNYQAILHNFTIEQYEKSSSFSRFDTKRERRLLLKKSEILKLYGTTHKTGKTIIPLSLFLTKRGLAKLKIGVASSIKLHDKRKILKEKAINKKERENEQ